MKKILLMLGVLLFVGAAASSGWFFVLNKQTTDEIYRESIENALQRKEGYVSYESVSDDIKFVGEIQGDLSVDSNTGNSRNDITVNTEDEGIPFSYDFELLTLAKDKNSKEAYMRARSITSSSVKYKANVEEYFAPVINKWQKLSDNEKGDDKTSFEDDGPFSGVVVSAIFIPLVHLDEADRAKYLEVLDKYDLYQVSKKFEETTFRGIAVRKLTVSVNKDTLSEFEKEVESVLNNDNFKRTSTTFLDQLFGNDDTITATVYLSSEENQLVGVECEIKFDKAITETVFNTTMKSIDTSVLIDSSRSLNIEPPKEFITEEQYNALLGSV